MKIQSATNPDVVIFESVHDTMAQTLQAAFDAGIKEFNDCAFFDQEIERLDFPEDVVFNRCGFSYTFIRYCDIDSTFNDCNFTKARIDTCETHSARFYNTRFYDAQINCCNFNTAECIKCDFTCVRFDRSRLPNLSDDCIINALSANAVDVPYVPNLDAAIYGAINGPGNSLDMRHWHNCETTHCRAGWAIHLAGREGYMLEAVVGAAKAGALIYLKNAGYIPNFYENDHRAMKDIEERATKV